MNEVMLGVRGFQQKAEVSWLVKIIPLITNLALNWQLKFTLRGKP